MKLLRIVDSDVAKGMKAVSLSGGRIYGVNLIRALEARYGFFEAPKTLDELDPKKGVQFRHGFFDGFVIDFELLENGVRAVSDGGTNLCEKFIDDVVGWAETEVGIVFEPAKDIRVYNSVVEVEMDGDFDSFFARLKEVGKYIGDRNAAHGGMPDEYRGVAIAMLGTLEGPAPSQFRLERRVRHPFDSKLYFSSAPLSTQDHLEALNQIEKAIS